MLFIIYSSSTLFITCEIEPTISSFDTATISSISIFISSGNDIISSSLSMKLHFIKSLKNFLGSLSLKLYSLNIKQLATISPLASDESILVPYTSSLISNLLDMYSKKLAISPNVIVVGISKHINNLSALPFI